MSRLAVVVLTMGGPDSLDAVRPFLFNLFADPAIIGAPWPIRMALAGWIASRRAPVAREIYARMGGRSPLLEGTLAQARALEERLTREEADEGKETIARVFTTMRYWHPRARQTVAEVRDFAPDRVVLLPLYPQYAAATSGSSLAEWRREAARAGLSVPMVDVCCHFQENGWIAAQADLIRPRLSEAGENARVLFSAHGLPERRIIAGDPYQWQVEHTVFALVERLKLSPERYVVCYQSRVGPLKWIGPATSDEIRRAGHDGVPVVLAPVAFVSEHSETLVELDVEYRHLAEESGVPAYLRVPTVGTHPDYIAALARMVRRATLTSEEVSSGAEERLCPAHRQNCPHPG